MTSVDERDVHGIALAQLYEVRKGIMTRAQWFLLGAVGLGIVILLYLIFFCPTECL